MKYEFPWDNPGLLFISRDRIYLTVEQFEKVRSYTDKLKAVAEAAKSIHICEGDFQDDEGLLRKALTALESDE